MSKQHTYFRETFVWVQRNIFEITDRTLGGGTPSTNNSEYWNGNIPWIQSSDLKKDNVLKEFSNKKITQVALKESAAKLIPKNSIAIVTRVGIGKLALIDNDFSTSQDFLSLINLKGDPHYFLYRLYILMKHESLVAQGTSIKGLTKQDLLSKKIHISTDLEEQVKIGNMFKNVDFLLAAYQRKVELLERQKQGYLQQIFSQNLRFKGYSIPWVQRKLGQVFYQEVQYIDPKVENVPLWSLTVADGLVEKTDRYNREFLVKKNDKFKLVKDNWFTYNPMNMTLGALDVNELRQDIAVSGYYVTMSLNNQFNRTFLKTWMKSYKAISLFKLYATGSLIEKQRVQFGTLSEIPSKFPKYDEQTKIGLFFDLINELIAAYQSKITLMQQQKQAYLQKMFI